MPKGRNPLGGGKDKGIGIHVPSVAVTGHGSVAHEGVAVEGGGLELVGNGLKVLERCCNSAWNAPIIRDALLSRA